MKLKFWNLSEYVRNNKRFSLLFLLVMLVVIYVGMDIYEDFSLRNMGSESNEARSELFSNDIVSSDKDDTDITAEENSEMARNEQGYNIYLTEDNGMPGHEAERGTEITAETEADSNNAIITKEEIEAMKEVMAERAAREAEAKAAAEAAEAAAAKEVEEEYEVEKPVYRPEPEPVAEVKNIELIVHIHFEDENGKSLPGKVVKITASKVGGGSLGSSLSDGEDARMSIPAVNCIITGQEISGFANEGGKVISLSNDDSVKHVSYKYRKVVE
ncbi:hypothetical protein SAMN02745751_02391 [Dethiosulfatibacter aminovorans DSM 17477]|uniref:Uncharacterized protein n=1 Tax=Dethiosulfatibacter aminovorans DSM 17477 TaxID=1121476 RepID=A0A1M6IQ92_9FIRM|nr:hypothetical protein [Dethiosulfatibacter aminovorans]SHJ36519.1 hypothetical protein SAMN02745751_02391 [Dethiosulfatibacter aminovorans DSM 17477]